MYNNFFEMVKFHFGTHSGDDAVAPQDNIVDSDNITPTSTSTTPINTVKMPQNITFTSSGDGTGLDILEGKSMPTEPTSTTYNEPFEPIKPVFTAPKNDASPVFQDAIKVDNNDTDKPINTDKKPFVAPPMQPIMPTKAQIEHPLEDTHKPMDTVTEPIKSVIDRDKDMIIEPKEVHNNTNVFPKKITNDVVNTVQKPMNTTQIDNKADAIIKRLEQNRANNNTNNMPKMNTGAPKQPIQTPMYTTNNTPKTPMEPYNKTNDKQEKMSISTIKQDAEAYITSQKELIKAERHKIQEATNAIKKYETELVSYKKQLETQIKELQNMVSQFDITA